MLSLHPYKNLKWEFTKFLIFLAGIFICSGYPCNASSVPGSEPSKSFIKTRFVFDTIPLNLQELTNEADRIFAGICTSIEEIENDSESGLSVIKYNFQISESIKGLENKQEITFKQWSKTAPDLAYEVGAKYILFLYPNSELGLTTPVGFLQGQFQVRKKGLLRKKETVSNKMMNKGLSRNLKTQKRMRIENNPYLDEYVNECSEIGSPIRYKEFVDAVKYLVKKDKEQ